ncbi:MAG: response regulator, partial [Rhizobacter sp.]|nr:response regulator [Rhizobacter sp.]
MPEVPSQETTDFQRVLTRHLALPLSVGIVSAAVFVGLIIYLLSTLNWVDHTQRVIGNANELTTLTVDLETGTRGFLLTGDEGYLEPYTIAKSKVPGQVAALVEMVSDNPVQVDRLRRIQGLEQQWDQIAQERITARRRGDASNLTADSEAGKQLFDEIRREFDSFTGTENRLLKERSDTARESTTTAVVLYVIFIMGLSALIAWSGRRQIVNMSQTYGSALGLQREATEHLERQAWLRAGQTQLAEQLMGEPTLPLVGRSVLDFSAATLGNVVAALYLRNDNGRLQRVASYGFDASAQSHGQLVGMEEGLVGQVAQDGKTKQVTGVYTDYFKVTSGLGSASPAHVIVAPVDNNGQTNGVLELGFMRTVGERDLALLELVAGHIGASLDAAENRQRLQQALAETRELNEELQQQQEELRSANEELEEQSTALMSSQANLEHQQAELEQTNSQLAQQAVMLDRRNDALSQAQAEIQQRADELQRASRYKSEFLANMSHELRTPLNSSLILAKLLSETKDGNLNEEQLKFAQIIYSAGNDLLTLINDILDLSKVEAGKLELTPQRVPLAKLAESLDSTFAPLARDKRLAFEIEVRPDAPDSLVTDSQRAEQILKNLLSNAIKFTEAGFVRLVIAPQAGGRLSFSVTDTGIGIAADQQAAVFEAFRQADGTINRRYGGTGLGLSISRELAALLGGSIDVLSEPGRGSTFTLSLPQEWQDHRPNAAQPAAPLPPPAVQAFTTPFPAPRAVPPSTVTSAAEAFASFADDRHDTTSTGRLLLVIDDDPQFAAILYELAHEMRYRCLVAHRAHEGLLLAAEHSPHAILLDIYLPDGSGLSVLQQLKEHPRTRHIPVHIVAAEDVSEVAMPMGAIGFAIKPTTRDQLKAVLGKLEDQVARKVKRVLLVEDDERQRQSVVHLIRDEDIEIEAVERGHQALE